MDCLEASLALALLQLLALFRPAWLRWFSWLLVLVALSVGMLLLALAALQPFLRHELWSTRAELFSPQAPYSTFRLFLFASTAALPLAWLLLGIFSLLRRGERGIRIVRWTVPLRASLLAVPCLLLALSIAAFINDRLVVRRIERMRDRGRELAASMAPPQCPPDENAAPVYLAIGAQAHTAQRRLPLRDDDINSLLHEECTEYFAQSAAQAEQLRAAAARPRCRFDGDFSDASLLRQHPEFDPLDACIHLLYLQGRRALLDGNADLAVENAVALRSISRQLAEDPRELAFFSARSADGKAGTLIEHLCYVRRPTEREVARLTEGSIECIQRLDKLFHWLEAKYYSGVADDYFGLAIDPEKMKKSPVYRAVVAVNLARMRLVHAPDDLRGLAPAFRAIYEFTPLQYEDYQREEVKSREPLWKQVKRMGTGHLGSSWLDSDLNVFYRGAQVSDMRHRLADYGLRVAQRDLVSAMLTEGPDQVIPPAERPIDLYDKKPLKIIAADGGIVIYSVDVYGGDDGGTEGIPASVAGRYLRDMTFCLGEAYKVRRLTPKKNDLDETSAPFNESLQ